MTKHRGLDFDGETALCPSCHAHTTPHCERGACGWWDCKDQVRCRSFGDAQRIAQRSPQ